MLLALLLWLYSFYRLYLVWQNTLNFSESSIQGPQGWDLLVSWVVERIRLRKLALRVLGVCDCWKKGASRFLCTTFSMGYLSPCDGA